MKNFTLDPKHEPRLKTQTSGFENSQVIEDDFILKNSDGKLVAIYLKNFVKREFGDFFRALKYADSKRTSGLLSKSQIFGFAPRDDLKRLPARYCKFNRENPDKYPIIEALAEKFEHKFKELEPETYAKHTQNAEVIPRSWRMKNTLYTSGIINLDTQYLYHTDNGNVENTLSSMLTFKHKVLGGDLHLPEYDILIKTHDCSLLIFDGARTSHGVTPFQKTAPDSYRVTVVWYVLDKLQKAAATPQLEINEYNRKIANVKLGKNKKLP